MHESDSALVQRARAGDRRAFGSLLTRHADTAMHLARRMVGEDCAREMVQEGALQAMLSLDCLQEDASFGPWLCGIVLNLCRNQLRRRREVSWEDLAGGTLPEMGLLVDPEPSPQEQVEALEMHGQVLAAVEGLSPKIRRAALLFYFEQLSLKEIAALLEISVGAVKGRLFKARRELAEQLWPLYAEWREIETERTDMTQVEIADVVAVQAGQSFNVLLLDRPGKRWFVMTIGQFEGNSLSLFLRGKNLPRPVTAQLTANILDALDAELSEVRIEKLEENVFYAVVVVKSGDQVKELDARPSDAMCLAALKEAPIYATEAVWKSAGKECSDEEIARMGQGLRDQEGGSAINFARVPVIYQAESEDPGQGRLVRIEIARVSVGAEELSGLGLGDGLTLPGGPTWLYLDDEPRFIGLPMDVGGFAGVTLVGKVPKGESAGDLVEGQSKVSVELARGWVELVEGEPASGWARDGAIVRFPQQLGDSVQVWVDGALWAVGSLHTTGGGYELKISERL